LEDTHCGIDRSHLRHFLTSLILPAAMITATACDLNDVQFISHDVEALREDACIQMVGPPTQ
jgi:hypothetical protein